MGNHEVDKLVEGPEQEAPRQEILGHEASLKKEQFLTGCCGSEFILPMGSGKIFTDPYPIEIRPLRSKKFRTLILTSR